MFESGVKYYTHGKAVIDVGFPEDKVCCRWCPWRRVERDGSRNWCRLNDEMLYNIDLQGDKCPVEVDEMEE